MPPIYWDTFFASSMHMAHSQPKSRRPKRTRSCDEMDGQINQSKRSRTNNTTNNGSNNNSIYLQEPEERHFTEAQRTENYRQPPLILEQQHQEGEDDDAQRHSQLQLQLQLHLQQQQEAQQHLQSQLQEQEQEQEQEHEQEQERQIHNHQHYHHSQSTNNQGRLTQQQQQQQHALHHRIQQLQQEQSQNYLQSTSSSFQPPILKSFVISTRHTPPNTAYREMNELLHTTHVLRHGDETRERCWVDKMDDEMSDVESSYEDINSVLRQAFLQRHH